MNTLLVSVIIPTYNRADMMKRCVESVLKSDYPNIEVIIIDDCSPDNTPEVIEELKSKDSRISSIRNATNQHQSYGRNVGADLSTGEYLFFLDDDNIVAPTMLSILANAMANESQLGLVAPLAIHVNTGKIWTLSAKFNMYTSMPISLHEGKTIHEITIDQASYDTDCSPNAFMVRKSTHKAINGFDPFYRVMFEESDYGLRIKQAGFSAAIIPAARTDHYGFLEPGSVPQLRSLGMETPIRAYCFARNRSVFAKRFAPSLGKISILYIFVPLFAVYYCSIALKNKRVDIAWAFLKGSVVGLFTPAYPKTANHK